MAPWDKQASPPEFGAVVLDVGVTCPRTKYAAGPLSKMGGGWSSVRGRPTRPGPVWVRGPWLW